MNARLDVTIRIKDVLRLMDTLGFLQKMKLSELPADASGPLFVNAVDEEALPEAAEQVQEELQDLAKVLNPDLMGAVGGGRRDDESDAGASEASKEGQDGVFGGAGGLGMIGGLGALSAAPKGGAVSGHPPVGIMSLLSPSDSGVSLENKQGEVPGTATMSAAALLQSVSAPVPAEGDAAKPAPAAKGEPVLTTEDITKSCNFGLSLLEALKLLAEVLSPDSRDKIKLLPDDSSLFAKEECVCLLDYVETEVIYTEFVRFLLRLAEEKTNHTVMEKMHLHERFEAFLKYIFLPARRVPYAPPAPEVEEKPKEEEPPQEEAPAEEGSKGPAEEPPAEEAPAEEPPQEEEEPYLEFWHGFDDNTLELEAAGVPRCWPDDYEVEN